MQRRRPPPLVPRNPGTLGVLHRLGPRYSGPANSKHYQQKTRVRRADRPSTHADQPCDHSHRSARTCPAPEKEGLLERVAGKDVPTAAAEGLCLQRVVGEATSSRFPSARRRTTRPRLRSRTAREPAPLVMFEVSGYAAFVYACWRTASTALGSTRLSSNRAPNTESQATTRSPIESRTAPAFANTARTRETATAAPRRR